MSQTRLALVVLSAALTGFCVAVGPDSVTVSPIIQGGLQCKARKVEWCLAEEAECPPGFRLIADANLCAPCEAGSFKNTSGDHGCLKCPAGTFTGSSGSSQCTQCPAGSYAGGVGNMGCMKCSPGTFSNIPGMRICLSCPAGTYSDSHGSRRCTKCPINEYSSSSGNTRCKVCPDGTIAPIPGSQQCYAPERIGCFLDKKGDRDIPQWMMMGSINSPSECVKYCISKGYSYAGLQAAKWCHCGNSFGRHGKVQDSECSMKCPGDNKWTCGNHFRNEVYSTLMRIGCFVDRETRDLNGFITGFGNGLPLYCVRTCKSKLFKYAAVQAAGWCLCGNSYGLYGSAPDTDCSRLCTMDSTQTYGGNWRNEVYYTGELENI